MKIAGFKKQSLIDYPGHLSSVVFTQGCNFRCDFCHNPELVLPEKFGKLYDEKIIWDYLAKYSTMLDAVCITGGEPTIHKDLPEFCLKIKNYGLKVKLDTNGTNPSMLEQMIKKHIVDYIAMDIKHILEPNAYNRATGNRTPPDIFDKILYSIELIRDSGIKHVFRTTVVKGLHTQKDIKLLKKIFGKNYVIQNYNPEVVLNPYSGYISFSEEEFDLLKNL